MKPRHTLNAGGLCALALVGLSLQASEPGDLMRITTTTHMHMAGMPSMGPITRIDKVCEAATRPDPRTMMSRNKQCSVTDYKQVGNTISYHVSCAQPPMSGDGKFTLLAGGGIHGTMHAVGSAGGHGMSMDMTEDGTRIGTCAYTPPQTR